MRRWHFFLELTEGVFVKVISGICSFWQANPRHQMLQKNSSAVMIVVIITTDLNHSNPTGVKRSGRVEPFVIVRVNYQLFRSSFRKVIQLNYIRRGHQKNNFCVSNRLSR